MLIEKEAREKVCPILATPEEKMTCIASDCMAWRWGARNLVRKDTQELVQPGQLYAEGDVVEVPNDHGYCGLAGKP